MPVYLLIVHGLGSNKKERAENMLFGMNAKATILLSSVNDALNILIDALVGQGKQVDVYTGYDEIIVTLLNPVLSGLAVPIVRKC